MPTKPLLPAADAAGQLREVAFALLFRDRRPVETAELAAVTGLGSKVVRDTVHTLAGAGWLDLDDAGPDPGLGLHLRFVEVASGAIPSERQVLLSDVFVTQLLPFFGQYALSHPPPVRVVHLSCSPQRPARSATTRRAVVGGLQVGL